LAIVLKFKLCNLSFKKLERTLMIF